MYSCKYLLIILGLILLLILPSLCFAEKLMIADFNRGEKPNLISGDFGAWNKTEWDRSLFCRESFTTDTNIVYGGRGCSLQLDYDVDSTNTPAYNGFWMRLEKINLAKYDEFIFYVKGDSNFGYTTVIKVEIKSIAGDIARFMVDNISDEWRKVVLPLYAIKQEGNFTEGYEFTIVFEDVTVTRKKGRIYIDQIYVQ